MTRYAAGRMLAAVPVLLGASILVFMAVFALPGDPATSIAGQGRVPDPATVAAITARYHLDEPLWVQYRAWAGHVIRGDLGESMSTRRPVRDLIGEALPDTIRLATGALVIELAIGAAVGVVAAVSHRRFARVLVLAVTTLAVAVPVYVLATLLQYGLGVRWAVLPISGTDDGLRSWILPALVLAIPSMAMVTQLTRSSLESTATAGHVDMARAHGMGPARILVHHRLRNAAVPVVTFLGIDFAALLGGTLFVETVFNIDGLGLLTTTAIARRDTPVIVGCTLVLVTAFVVVSLVVDLLVAGLDPRVRVG